MDIFPSTLGLHTGVLDSRPILELPGRIKKCFDISEHNIKNAIKKLGPKKFRDGHGQIHGGQFLGRPILNFKLEKSKWSSLVRIKDTCERLYLVRLMHVHFPLAFIIGSNDICIFQIHTWFEMFLSYRNYLMLRAISKGIKYYEVYIHFVQHWGGSFAIFIFTSCSLPPITFFTIIRRKKIFRYLVFCDVPDSQPIFR